MPTITRHEPGMFCFADLQTKDHEAARRFYTQLMGWTAQDVLLAPGRTYTRLLLDGSVVAALSQLEPNNPMPSHWLNYVAVESADATAARVEPLGGKLFAPPFDVADQGRLAIVGDPAGAWVAVWEARRFAGAQRHGEPGALCWAELLARDVETAGRFYGGLFGWQVKRFPGGGDYYLFDWGADRSAGGMMPITPQMGAMPPMWNTYFAVARCVDAVERARALKAEIYVPPTEIEEVGTFATIRDPQGGVFSILQPRTK